MEMIDRTSLLNRLERLELKGGGIAEAIETVRERDAVEIAPRLPGVWRGRDPQYFDWRNEPFYKYFVCSVCSAAFDADWNPEKWKYCPLCGAEHAKAVVPGTPA